ncbi:MULTISPECIES: hypothetical protein [unclassified Streptomyces]|uniref:hypothetical protein n=2 Tax=Streptomyces TaxID=1883 RepID=UPI0038708713
MEGVQDGQFALGKAQRACRHVLGEVVEVAGAGMARTCGPRCSVHASRTRAVLTPRTRAMACTSLLSSAGAPAVRPLSAIEGVRVVPANKAAAQIRDHLADPPAVPDDALGATQKDWSS